MTGDCQDRDIVSEASLTQTAADASEESLRAQLSSTAKRMIRAQTCSARMAEWTRRTNSENEEGDEMNRTQCGDARTLTGIHYA